MFKVLSPCKINLFLNITGKRADGFHNLQSLFCMLNHGDEMTFEVDNDGRGEITLVNTMGMKPEENLIYRAVRALQEHSGRRFSVTVDVKKVLPMGGGLGGGSSNAATTLLVVNHLAKLNMDNQTLQNIGATLGSDVPFFVGGHHAYVEGRGEYLRFLELDERWYLVVTPDCHVSTREIFTDPGLKEHFSPERTFEDAMDCMYNNDCECTVRKKFSEVGLTLDYLVKYGRAAMSGTGASCYVAFDTREEALKAHEDLCKVWDQDFSFQAFVTESINVSPVTTALMNCQA